MSRRAGSKQRSAGMDRAAGSTVPDGSDRPGVRPAQGARRVSTPLVLAAGSTMLSIGVVAFLLRPLDAPPRADDASRPAELLLDDSSAERVAESYLDAWRKRRFDEAAKISRGDARTKAQQRAAQAPVAEAADPGAADLWQALAGPRLVLNIQESERLAPTRLLLRGVGVGQLMEQPYEREFEFITIQEGDRWFVESMTPGRVLQGPAPSTESP